MHTIPSKSPMKPSWLSNYNTIFHSLASEIFYERLASVSLFYRVSINFQPVVPNPPFFLCLCHLTLAAIVSHMPATQQPSTRARLSVPRSRHGTYITSVGREPSDAALSGHWPRRR